MDSLSSPPPPSPRAQLARFGEDLAAHHLQRLGCEVLERNWRCRHGEVDIVARLGPTLVICEVKTRRSTDFGHPVEAVTSAKLARLRRLAAAWVDEHRVGLSGVQHVRIDVIGILAPRSGRATLRHLVAVGG